MTTRLLFLGPRRLMDSVVTLTFDHMLNPRPDKTIIHCKLPEGFTTDELYSLYRRFGINYSTFTIVQDHEFLEPYESMYDLDEFGGWIKQQLIKFLAIEHCDDTEILIQDCDTAAINPYQYFDNGYPVMSVLYNTTHHPDYYAYIGKFLNIARQTKHCFITEFMPLIKSDWISFRERIEAVHSKEWFSALLSQFKKDFKPIKGSWVPLWFSEYELFGNWVLHQNKNAMLCEQHRLLIEDNDAILIKNRNFTITKPINSVCFTTENVILNENDMRYVIGVIKEYLRTNNSELPERLKGASWKDDGR